MPPFELPALEMPSKYGKFPLATCLAIATCAPLSSLPSLRLPAACQRLDCGAGLECMLSWTGGMVLGPSLRNPLLVMPLHRRDPRSRQSQAVRTSLAYVPLKSARSAIRPGILQTPTAVLYVSLNLMHVATGDVSHVLL